MSYLCSYCNCVVTMPCQNLEDMAECGNPEIIINNKLLEEKNKKAGLPAPQNPIEFKPPFGAYTMADWDDENY